MTQKMNQNLEKWPKNDPKSRKIEKNGKRNKLKSNKKRQIGGIKNLQKIVSIRETYQLGG